MPRKLVALPIAVVLIASSVLVGCGPSQGNAAFHYNQGVDLREQGRNNEAIQKFDEAIRLNPEYDDAYYNRGNAYYDLGQFERAIQDYDEAIRLNPQYGLAYANRTLAHTVLGMDAEAEQDFNRAVELGFPPDILKKNIERLKRQR